MQLGSARFIPSKLTPCIIRPFLRLQAVKVANEVAAAAAAAIHAVENFVGSGPATVHLGLNANYDTASNYAVKSLPIYSKVSAKDANPSYSIALSCANCWATVSVDVRRLVPHCTLRLMYADTLPFSVVPRS